MPEIFELDQAIHGYDGGHRLLAASAPISLQDDRAMLSMSDLSGTRVADGFLEYVTGYMLPSNEFFVIAKTWYATEMKRPGCVWTHSLLLSKAAVNMVRDAEPLASLFVRPQLETDFRYSNRLRIPRSALFDGGPKLGAISNGDVARVVEEFYSHDQGGVGIVASSGISFESFLLRLWSQMWPALRIMVGFCSGSLSVRVLEGKPLDLQCGPERVVRELRGEGRTTSAEGAWAQVILEDLKQPGEFRQFLRDSAADSFGRRSMSILARVFAAESIDAAYGALQLVAEAYPREDQALNLKRRALRRTADSSERLDVPQVVHTLVKPAFDHVQQDAGALLARLIREDRREFLRACDLLRLTARRETIAMLIGALAIGLAKTDFEWMSEATPELFSDLLIHSPAIAYQPAFWNWNFSIFEKVEFFRTLLRQPNVSRNSLFRGVFASGDGELLSRLIGDMSEEQLPLALEWIQNNEATATSLEWTSYLRSHQFGFVLWLNHLEQFTLQTVILTANVLDPLPSLQSNLSSDCIKGLADAARRLPHDRHEVAAFLFVITPWVPAADLAPIFCESFVLLHEAIAQSRLSNRAWQLLSSVLMPLPDEQWDSCEKLRRAVLHFLPPNWDFRVLWRFVADDLDLFYDFTRTARSFGEGRRFLKLVYDASKRGEVDLAKKQAKELRRFFGDSFW